MLCSNVHTQLRDINHQLTFKNLEHIFLGPEADLFEKLFLCLDLGILDINFKRRQFTRGEKEGVRI